MKKVPIVLIALVLALSSTAQAYKGSERPSSPEQALNDCYCTGLFKSTDGTILDVQSQVSARGYMNILNWLPGRVAGLQVYPTRTGISIPLIRGTVPGLYVDEIPVPLSYLQSLSVSDIAMVKVIKTPFFGGFNGGGGAIAIYTIGSEEEPEEE